MSGLELWISNREWIVLITGLLLSAVLAAVAVWSMVRAVRRVRAAASGLIVVGPLILCALAVGGLVYFGTTWLIIGPESVGQTRLTRLERERLIEEHRDLVATIERMVGTSAPEVRFVHVSDGTEVTLEAHRGSVVLVNLWATWCRSCRHELPELDRLQQTYGDQGVVVLQISDEPRSVLEEFLATSPMSTEHGFAPELPLPEAGRPTTFVIDRAGIIRQVIFGPRSFKQFEAAISSLL